jgi:hypothetical protein
MVAGGCAMSLRDKLHAIVRADVDAINSSGRVFDKKQLRFNDIVEAGMRYGAVSSEFSENAAIWGAKEAVLACVVGDPMYVKGGSVLDIVPEWMVQK